MYDHNHLHLYRYIQNFNFASSYVNIKIFESLFFWGGGGESALSALHPNLLIAKNILIKININNV